MNVVITTHSEHVHISAARHKATPAQHMCLGWGWGWGCGRVWRTVCELKVFT